MSGSSIQQYSALDVVSLLSATATIDLTSGTGPHGTTTPQRPARRLIVHTTSSCTVAIIPIGTNAARQIRCQDGEVLDVQVRKILPGSQTRITIHW